MFYNVEALAKAGNSSTIVQLIPNAQYDYKCSKLVRQPCFCQCNVRHSTANYRDFKNGIKQDT